MNWILLGLPDVGFSSERRMGFQVTQHDRYELMGHQVGQVSSMIRFSWNLNITLVRPFRSPASSLCWIFYAAHHDRKYYRSNHYMRWNIFLYYSNNCSSFNKKFIFRSKDISHKNTSKCNVILKIFSTRNIVVQSDFDWIYDFKKYNYVTP